MAAIARSCELCEQMNSGLRFVLVSSRARDRLLAQRGVERALFLRRLDAQRDHRLWRKLAQDVALEPPQDERLHDPSQ